MIRILSAIILLVVASNTYANDIEGTWKASTPDGGMELTFVFKLVDGKLTGVVSSPNGDMPISNTKIDGKQFSFDVSVNDMVIKHDCIMQDDGSISMKASGTPMGDMALILKRKV